MPITLRPITAADSDLLLAIYASTREQELALTNWSAEQREAFLRMQFAAQHRHYRQRFPESSCHVISLSAGGAAGEYEPIGRIWVNRDARSMHILDISLLPHARGQGVGTRLLRQLMDEAQARAVPLSVYVEIDNPARRLYERLGLSPQGEPEGLHQRMTWPRQFATEGCST